MRRAAGAATEPARPRDPAPMMRAVIRRAVVAPLTAAAALALVPAQASSAVTIRVADDLFSPGSLTVSKGTALKFRWVGDSAHDVVATRGKKKIWSIGLRSRGTVTRKFSSAGTYKLVCTVHAPDMTATIKVR